MSKDQALIFCECKKLVDLRTISLIRPYYHVFSYGPEYWVCPYCGRMNMHVERNNVQIYREIKSVHEYE
jgi:hypothetical protein